MKQEYENQIREKEKLFKEVQFLRVTKEDSNRKMHDDLNRLMYEKNTLEKNYTDIRETNNSLQMEIDRLTLQEK